VEGRAGADLKLLAVTVLTSFGREDMEEMGYQGEIAELVGRRARLAMECGVDGIVPRRSRRGPAPPLRSRTHSGHPGVRSPGANRGDRSASPPPPKPCATAPATW